MTDVCFNIDDDVIARAKGLPAFHISNPQDCILFKYLPRPEYT